MRLLYTLILILLSVETYSQKKVIFGEVFSDISPFIGYLFFDHGDSLRITDGTFSLSYDKTKVIEKTTICFKRPFTGDFSIVNIPLEKDSLYLGKIIIPPLLTYNETQMDSIRQRLMTAMKDSVLVGKLLTDNYDKYFWVIAVDPVKPQYRDLVKRDTTKIKTHGYSYQSKYIFARPYIPCPLDLSKKIVISYYESDKTGYVDYQNLKDCGK